MVNRAARGLWSTISIKRRRDLKALTLELATAIERSMMMHEFAMEMYQAVLLMVDLIATLGPMATFGLIFAAIVG